MFLFQVTKVSHEHNASSQLEKEARKAATRIAKESKTIRDTTRQLQILQQQQQQQPPQHTATSDRKSSKVGWRQYIIYRDYYVSTHDGSSLF